MADGVRVLSRPLVVAACALAAGVLSATPGRLAAPTAISAIGSALLLFHLGRRRRLISVAFLVTTFFLSGAALEAIRTPPEETITKILGTPSAASRSVIEGIVRDAPEIDEGRSKMIVDTAAVAPSFDAPLVPASGTLALWIERDVGSRPPCGDAGDRIRVLAAVRVPEEAAFPGDVSQRAIAERQGVALFAHARPRDPCVVLRPQEMGGIRVAMERLRSRVHQAIDRNLPQEEASVVRAFATGDRARISREVNDDFAASGLSHLLAVSGLNLAIVSGLFVVALLALFRALPALSLTVGARRLAASAAVPFVAGYTLFVGASPSSVRACVMVLALLASYILLRGKDAPSALALAVIAMIAIDPGVLLDVSFQLSFAAVASLLIVYPALKARASHLLERLPRALRWAADVALVSAAATVGTLPLVAWHFQRFSIVGLFANVPAAPLSSLILVPLSLAGGLAGTVSDAVAHPILAVAGWTAKLLVFLAHASAHVPGGAIHVPPPNALECALFTLGTILLALSSRRRALSALGAACFLAIAAECAVLELARIAGAKIVAAVLPVGQGDGAVIELPHGRVLVIDTGPSAASPKSRSAAERVLLPYLRARRIRAVDRLILTHPHADHTGGVAQLAAEVPVKEIWWTEDQREGPPGLAQAVLKSGARLVRAGAGTPPETLDGVTIEVLGPTEDASAFPIVNDGSIVVRIRYKDRALLFTGDAEAGAESAMLARCAPCLAADVLKAGHHGSKTSTTLPFLRATNPRHAIISAGSLNRFGFPHRPVLRRLADAGVTTWRTDLSGAIFIETDGYDLRVRAYRQNR